MKYPYALPPESRYWLNAANIGSTNDNIDFFYKYKKASENLHLGKISPKLFDIEGSEYILNNFLNYLNNSFFLQPATKNSNVTLKQFPKLCWLTDSYFREGFLHPVCVHYNPRIQCNVMHPGSTRNHIINLFHDGTDIDCLYFNTGGVVFDFLKNMILVGKHQLLAYPNVSMSVVFDHCSTIPHVNVEGHTPLDYIPFWQTRIKNRFTESNFKVYMNKRIPHLLNWYTNDESVDIRVYIDDVTNKNDVVKACLLVAIGKPYTSPTLTVMI
jgi:hypothetical protein